MLFSSSKIVLKVFSLFFLCYFSNLFPENVTNATDFLDICTTISTSFGNYLNFSKINIQNKKKKSKTSALQAGHDTAQKSYQPKWQTGFEFYQMMTL